jgi:multidrug resistance efflux pump
VYVAVPKRHPSRRPPTSGWPAALAVALACAVAGALACARPEPAAVAAEAGLVVHRGRLVERLLLTGELKAARAGDIVVPRTPTWQVQLRWLEVDGAEVEAGQKLFELDNTAVAGNLAERRLEAERAARELDRLAAQLQVQEAEAIFEVEEARVALAKAASQATVPEGLLSGRDHQERQLARERAATTLLKAEEELVALRRGAEADLAVQRLQLEKTRRDIEIAERAIAELAIAAPRAGILLVADHPWEGRKLQAGDNVWVGMTLGRMPDLSSLEVEAGLSDVDDGRVAVGDDGRCVLDAYPDLALDCRVEEITPVARESPGASLRRFFRVRLTLAAVDVERMRPGMSVKVELHRAADSESLLAPRAALDLAGREPRARLDDGSLVAVRLGACSSSACQVLEGLAEGARLRPARGGEA